jgi:SHS2 domain-containing protein
LLRESILIRVICMHHYKVFDHTADLGIEVFGGTQAELFCHAALALSDLLVDARGMKTTDVRNIAIEGDNITDLFINFLREILYLFNGKGFLLTSCRVERIDDRQLIVEIRGGRYDARKHRVKTEIKAVTYHQAAVRKTAEGWQGRVVFDV